MLKNIVDKSFPINEYITHFKALSVDELTIKTNTISNIKTSTDTKTVNDTDIATTGYINKFFSNTGNTESLEELEGRVTTTENNINSLDTLKYDKADIIAVQASINEKAEKNNVYTKAQTDALILNKVDDGDVYSNLDVDNLLSYKADKINTYTKTETNNLLDQKANTTNLNNLTVRVTTNETNINNLSTNSATKTELNNVIATVETKANKNELLAAGDTEFKEWKLLNFATSETSFYSIASNNALNNPIFVCTAQNVIYYSYDLIKWVLVTLPSTSQQYYDIDYGNGVFITAGNGGEICKSTDGINWVEKETTNYKYSGCRYINNTFFAVGENIISYSTNGDSWTHKTTLYFDGIEDITYFNNRYIVCGYGNTYAKVASFLSLEDDLTDETKFIFYNLNSAKNSRINAINNLNNHLVIVGSNGYYFVSDDGIYWTKKTFANSRLYNSYFYQNVYVVCGESGKIWTSTDEINWTEKTLTSSYLLDIIEHATYGLICVGYNRVVLISKNPTLKNININYLTSENALSESNHKTISAGYLNKYYSTSSAISSTYATTSYVNSQIAEIPQVDLTNYATKSYVVDKIAEIPQVDLTDYYTKTETDNKYALKGYPKIKELWIANRHSTWMEGIAPVIGVHDAGSMGKASYSRINDDYINVTFNYSIISSTGEFDGIYFGIYRIIIENDDIYAPINDIFGTNASGIISIIPNYDTLTEASIKYYPTLESYSIGLCTSYDDGPTFKIMNTDANPPVQLTDTYRVLYWLSEEHAPSVHAAENTTFARKGPRTINQLLSQTALNARPAINISLTNIIMKKI